jgi:DNA-binding NarL/FixJ family response regulator
VLGANWRGSGTKSTVSTRRSGDEWPTGDKEILREVEPMSSRMTGSTLNLANSEYIEWQVGQLYLRGMRVSRTARLLHLPEATVDAHLSKVLAEWTSVWGSLQVGECMATFRTIDEVCRQQADRPGLGLRERRQFERLALTVARREQALLLRLGGFDDDTDDKKVTAYIEAVKRALRESEKPAVLDVKRDDRRREVERLLGRGWTEAQIAHELDVSAATIREDVPAIREMWSADFRTAEAGKLLARYRDTSERMFDMGMGQGTCAVDKTRFLQTALSARGDQLSLLVQLGLVDAARQVRQVRVTPEELAEIRATWNDQLFSEEFIKENGFTEQGCASLVRAIRKGSRWE